MLRSRAVLNQLLKNPKLFDLSQNFLRVDQVRQYFVDNYVKPFPGARLLDVGCGTGELLPFLDGVQYEGIDCDARYVQTAERRFGHLGKFSLKDLSKTEYPDETFDILIASGVIHHLNDAQAGDLFRLAARVLRPGGRFCSFDMCDRPGAFFPWIMNRLDRGKFVRTEPAYLKLTEGIFSDVKKFDFCGELLIPVNHLVMVWHKPSAL